MAKQMSIKELQACVSQLEAEASNFIERYRYRPVRVEEELGKLVAYRNVLRIIREHEEEESDDGR